MTERECAEAVRDWALATLDDLVTGYAYLTAQKEGLPDVAVEVAFKRTRIGPDENFPFAQLQNAGLREFTVVLYFMVETAVDTTADEDETQQLQAFGRDLEAAALEDATLGDRVQMTSPLMQFDYTAPFIQYQDGTRGRQMVMTMIVGELAPEVIAE